MDLFHILQLADFELSWGGLAAVIGGGLTSIGAGLKVVWNYWIKREREKSEAWQAVVAGKDALIAAKDTRIEELSKELSRKSDAHAAKIQELMGVTLDKVEGWSGKLEQVIDRSLKVQADFTSEVRKLNWGHGPDLT